MGEYIGKLADELVRRMTEAGHEMEVVVGHKVVAQSSSSSLTGSSSSSSSSKSSRSSIGSGYAPPLSSLSGGDSSNTSSGGFAHPSSSSTTTTTAPVRAQLLTLKIMRRKGDAGAPMKFMGHGRCDTFSLSKRLPAPTCDAAVIATAATRAFDELQCPAEDLRGIGIHMRELFHPTLSEAEAGGNASIRSYFQTAAASVPAATVVCSTSPDPATASITMRNSSSSSGGSSSSSPSSAIIVLDDDDDATVEVGSSSEEEHQPQRGRTDTGDNDGDDITLLNSQHDSDHHSMYDLRAASSSSSSSSPSSSSAAVQAISAAPSAKVTQLLRSRGIDLVAFSELPADVQSEILRHTMAETQHQLQPSSWASSNANSGSSSTTTQSSAAAAASSSSSARVGAGYKSAPAPRQARQLQTTLRGFTAAAATVVSEPVIVIDSPGEPQLLHSSETNPSATTRAANKGVRWVVGGEEHNFNFRTGALIDGGAVTPSRVTSQQQHSSPQSDAAASTTTTVLAAAEARVSTEALLALPAALSALTPTHPEDAYAIMDALPPRLADEPGRQCRARCMTMTVSPLNGRQRSESPPRGHRIRPGMSSIRGEMRCSVWRVRCRMQRRHRWGARCGGASSRLRGRGTVAEVISRGGEIDCAVCQ